MATNVPPSGQFDICQELPELERESLATRRTAGPKTGGAAIRWPRLTKKWR
ncbi:MAG TPA: hypothetical protein VGN12_24155 [Pirellulales bacterium]|jgi:hypothetical protein